VRRRKRLGRGQFRRGRCGKRGDLGIGNDAIGSGDPHLAVRDFEVGDRRLELVGRQFLQRARQGFRRADDHHGADGNRSRSARAEARRDPIGVALYDLDALKGHVEKLRDGLGIGGLMSLPVRLGADGEREIAALLKRQRAGFGIAPGGAFDIARDAEAPDLAAPPRVIRATRETRIVRLLQAAAHRAFEIADVVIAIGMGVIGHLLGLDEIARAQFLGRDAKLARASVDQPLKHISSLGTSGPAIGVDGHGVGVDSTDARMERDEELNVFLLAKNAKQAAEVLEANVSNAVDQMSQAGAKVTRAAKK